MIEIPLCDITVFLNETEPMNIIKGTNYWRLVSFIQAFILFICLYYFFIVYPKDTEQARIQTAEEILTTFYWLEFSNKIELYISIFKQGLQLNPVNDEIYIKELSKLRAFYFWSNEEKNITPILNKYLQYSSYDMKAVHGFCLELKFIKKYGEKIKKTKYSSSRLTLLQNINNSDIETISSWINDINAFEKFYESKKMIPNCKI